MDFGRKDYNEFLGRIRVTSESDLRELQSDEPVFLIRGTDPLAIKLMTTYVSELVLEGADDRVVDSVMEHIKRVRKYQKINGTKGADLTREDRYTIEDMTNISALLNIMEVNQMLNPDDMDKLHDLMERVFGKKSVCVLMPGEYIQDNSLPIGLVCGPARKPDFDEAKVCYALFDGRLILMKRKGL